MNVLNKWQIRYQEKITCACVFDNLKDMLRVIWTLALKKENKVIKIQKKDSHYHPLNWWTWMIVYHSPPWNNREFRINTSLANLPRLSTTNSTYTMFFNELLQKHSAYTVYYTVGAKSSLSCGCAPIRNHTIIVKLCLLYFPFISIAELIRLSPTT